MVTRALHRSLLLGLVLAGLDPVWVLPGVDPATGLPGPVPVAAVRDALARHPDACAVFLDDPSYVGTTGDLWPGTWPTPRTRPGCRCWLTRPGPRTSVSTRGCRRTRWPPGPTPW